MRLDLYSVCDSELHGGFQREGDGDMAQPMIFKAHTGCHVES